MKMRILGRERKKARPDKAVHLGDDDPFPNVRLSSHRVPAVKDLKVGDKCTLTFDGEVTGTRASDHYENRPEGTVHADFKLTHGDFVPRTSGKKKDYKNMEDAMDDAIEEGKDHEARKRLSSKGKGY